MELAKLRARSSNGFAFGDGSHYAVKHLKPSRVPVAGDEFDLSREDSVLVIMVAVPDTLGRRTIQTASLSAATAPNIAFTRQGTGSDFRLVPVPHFTAVRY